jgi:hypothetical protein
MSAGWEIFSAVGNESSQVLVVHIDNLERGSLKFQLTPDGTRGQD